MNAKKRKKREFVALNAVIDMQEFERKRIAEDLHDQIGPILSAIKLKINSMRQTKNISEIESTVKETTSHLDTIIQDVRQVVRNLSPTKLNENGLIQTIEDFKNTIEEGHNIRFEFMHEGMDTRMREKAEINLYRIIAELINNSLKHSGCSLIKLMMKRYEKKTIIIYTDNGVNSGPGKMAKPGMGLKNIESRVNSFRGTLHSNKSFADGAYYSIAFENYILTESNE